MFNNCTLWITLIFIVTIELWGNGLAVKVNKIIIPSVVTANTPVTMDCDYTLDDPNEEGLVVKWYFNDDMLVYQWIIGHQPTSSGILRKRVNLNYTVSSHPYHIYRAINILKATPDIAGNYTCKVSTLLSEDSQKQQMIVLVKPSSLDIGHDFIARKYEISCVARGVFPKPNMILRFGNRIINDTTVKFIASDSAFDVEAKAVVFITTKQEVFSCELNIPQTDYFSRKTGIIPHIDIGYNGYEPTLYAKSSCNDIEPPKIYFLIISISSYIFNLFH